MDPDEETVQVEVWERLLVSVRHVLEKFGKEDFRGRADFLLVEDNYGTKRITVSLQNLQMFHPNIVMALRALVSGLPDWEIEMLVDIPGKESWPPMGLVVRNHEIVDDLRRDLFPAELRSFRYPDSRAGPP
jgi:hypothetical protein